jgi:hypothetical protein
MNIDRLASAMPKALIVLILFTGLSVALNIWWNIGEGFYLIKGSGESFPLYLSAYNITDWQSFFLQNVSTSTTPLWYIHHPNLLAKLISYGFQGLGLTLESQVGLMLILSFLGLGILAAALYPISRWSAVIAVFVAVTSWGSFHFNAGDLLRAPTYILLWLAVYGVVKNVNLKNNQYNFLLASVTVLSVLSDWGFALFIIGFIYCYCTLQYPNQAFKWFIKHIGIPSAFAFLLYLIAVINTVGVKVFMVDFLYSYLHRVVGVNFRSEQIFQALNEVGFDNIITWANLSPKNITIFVFIEVINDSFDDLIWIFRIVVQISLVGLLAQKILQMQMKWWWWLLSIIAIHLNVNYGVSFIIYLVILIPILVRLNYLILQYQDNRMKNLVFAVLMSVFLVATIFPGYAINFLFVGGRSPMPILAIRGSAFVVAIINMRAREAIATN